MHGQLTTKQEYNIFLTTVYTHANKQHLSLDGVHNTLKFTFRPPHALTASTCTILLDRILLFRIYKNDGREWLKNEYKRLSLLRENLLSESGDFELN